MLFKLKKRDVAFHWKCVIHNTVILLVVHRSKNDRSLKKERKKERIMSLFLTRLTKNIKSFFLKTERLIKKCSFQGSTKQTASLLVSFCESIKTSCINS